MEETEKHRQVMGLLFIVDPDLPDYKTMIMLTN